MSNFKRVRVGSSYYYVPVFLDRNDAKIPVSWIGKLVKVINLPGCPAANTMGHCYISDPASSNPRAFLGMVCCNSLVSKADYKAGADGGPSACLDSWGVRCKIADRVIETIQRDARRGVSASVVIPEFGAASGVVRLSMPYDKIRAAIIDAGVPVSFDDLDRCLARLLNEAGASDDSDDPLSCENDGAARDSRALGRLGLYRPGGGLLGPPGPRLRSHGLGRGAGCPVAFLVGLAWGWAFDVKDRTMESKEQGGKLRGFISGAYDHGPGPAGLAAARDRATKYDGPRGLVFLWRGSWWSDSADNGPAWWSRCQSGEAVPVSLLFGLAAGRASELRALIVPACVLADIADGLDRAAEDCDAAGKGDADHGDAAGSADLAAAALMFRQLSAYVSGAARRSGGDE